MKNSVKISATILVLLLLAGLIIIPQLNLDANFSAGKDTKDTIKIGGMFSLTGTTAFAGQSEANFAQLAIDEINADGGINGKQIEFILEDEKCDAKEAVTIANKLIEQDGVKIILGPSCSPATAAVAPISSSKKVIIMAGSSLAIDIFKGKEYSFRTSPQTTPIASLQAKQTINSKNIKNISIISELSNFPKSWTDDFEKEFTQLGGQVKARFDFSSEEKDFRTILLKINESKPEAVFISTLGPAIAIQIIKQMSELGMLDKVTLLGNHTSTDSEVNNGLGGLMPNTMYTVVPYNSNSELLNKYTSKYGKEPTFEYFYTAAMYDAVYLLKDAITLCGENTDCIQSYLKKPDLNFNGGVTVWNFDAKGDPIFPKDAYYERRIENGVKKYYEIK